MVAQRYEVFTVGRTGTTTARQERPHHRSFLFCLQHPVLARRFQAFHSVTFPVTYLPGLMDEPNADDSARCISSSLIFISNIDTGSSERCWIAFVFMLGCRGYCYAKVSISVALTVMLKNNAGAS